MIKLTVLYGHPGNPSEFESYYSQSHHPLLLKTPGIEKWEYTKFLSDAAGAAPAHYRMAELYFINSEAMQQAMASDEGKAMAADLANFATGGVTILIGNVETV